MTQPTRTYPADEITRDPVFLLELRRVIPTCPELEFDWDNEQLMHGDNVATDEYLIENELCTVVWEVYSDSGVWFTREEAEAWANAHSYRANGRENFRVYCVCAAGELAKLLDSVTLKERTPA